jgi:hydrogenase maturation protease
LVVKLEDRKTLIIGLGNPILGDDGVGWQVARQAAEAIYDSGPRRSPGWKEGSNGSSLEIDCLAVGGFSLMERMIGYDRVILIDAISSGQNLPGAVLWFPLDDLPDRAAGHMNAAHDTSLQTALQVGRLMGASLPEQIDIVAVEAQSLYEFSEELTAPVAAAVSRAVQAVLDMLSEVQE